MKKSRKTSVEIVSKCEANEALAREIEKVYAERKRAKLKTVKI